MNKIHRWLLIIALVMAGWTITASSTVLAQSERYELGKRLRRFELAWQDATTEKRAAATPMMQRAVESFFSLQLRQAASQLDEAFFEVRATDEPASLERAWLARRWQMDPVTVDAVNQKFVVLVKPFYKSASSVDASQMLDDMTAHLSIFDQKAQSVANLSFGIDDLREGRDCDLALPEGDYEVEIAAQLADAQIKLPRRQLSVITDMKGRLEKITAWLKQQSLESQRTDDLLTCMKEIQKFKKNIN